jgi:hypothetical protein
MAAEAISAARATSVGNKVEELLAQSSRAVATDRARDDLYPTPKNGDVVWRTDLGIEQRYYEAYSAQKNPGGRTPAGWYATRNTFVPIISEFAFTNVANLTLSNVFNVTFENYLIICDLTSSIGTQIYGRFATNSVVQASGLYNTTRIGSENSVTTAGSTAATTVFVLNSSVAATSTKHNFKVTVTNPMQPQYTRVAADYASAAMTTLQVAGKSSGILKDTNRYDGFYFYPSLGGTITGVVSIYGYN